MSVIYIDESDSKIYNSEENMLSSKTKPTKRTKTMNKSPYGRKRSCWKKKSSSGDESLTKGSAESGVITCAVCGIQRYYKFLKQTKKFGLPSCEPCRKFISSMILYVKNDEQLYLTCSKDSMKICLNNENFTTKNGNPKSKKDALSNMRCKSCWLLLCLEKYEMPLGLKNSLAQFLSEDIRPNYFSQSANSSDDLTNNHDQSISKQNLYNNNSGKFKTCMETLTENFINASGLNKSLEESKKKIIILRIRC